MILLRQAPLVTINAVAERPGKALEPRNVPGSPGFFDKSAGEVSPRIRHLAMDLTASMLSDPGASSAQEQLLSDLMISVIDRRGFVYDHRGNQTNRLWNSAGGTECALRTDGLRPVRRHRARARVLNGRASEPADCDKLLTTLAM